MPELLALAGSVLAASKGVTGAAREPLATAAEELLRAACQAAGSRSPLRHVAPSSRYVFQLRRRVVRAFRRVHPEHAAFGLFPDTVLRMPRGLPPPPRVEELTDPPKRLEVLWRLSVVGRSSMSWDGLSWPLPSRPRPHAPTSTWGGPPEARAAYRLAATWPAQEAGELFRIALEAGWNDAIDHLPDAAWAPALRRVLEDTPYAQRPMDGERTPGAPAPTLEAVLDLAARTLQLATRESEAVEAAYEDFDFGTFDADMVAYREALKRSASADTPPPKRPDDFFLPILAREDVRDLLHGAAQGILRGAAEMGSGARYPRLRATLAAFRERHPRHTAFALSPEPRLDPPADAPSPPPPDERFDALRGPRFLDVYDQLVALPPEKVPEAAFAPLCRLLPSGNRMWMDLQVSSPDELLASCGPHALPAILDYLSRPEAHGWQAEGWHVWDKAPRHLFSPPAHIQSVFYAIARWPGDDAEPLLRLAFEAGWNHAIRFCLPKDRFGPALAAEFADSPYGPPIL